MPIPACPAARCRRRMFLVLAAAGLSGAVPAAAQDAPKLRPGEAIEVPAGSITVLGVDIRRGTPTRVTLKLRATAGAQQSLLVDLDTFRLLAAGVPRAPDYATTAERQMSSFVVEKDSAVDFTRVFAIPDKTDDLVLQVRSGGAIERRRLAGP